MGSPAYPRASELLRTATADAAGGDTAAALRHVQEGLDALGDAYVSEDVVDDTGLRLVLSSAEEKKGNLEGALRLRRTALENRLAQLQQKERGGR